MTAPPLENSDDAIGSRTDFSFVRYANCWEDADVLVEALHPAAGKRILSIASAGDNVLALLATGAEVVAVDLSPAQLACLELRCAAFRRLDHEELLAFMGVTASDQRGETYERLRGDLSDSAQHFWRKHLGDVSQGVIHMGKFEAYFRLFRTKFLPWIHRPETIARLLQPKSQTERIAFYREVWNNRRWRMLLRIFFSRFMMARLGRDREFFRYVEGSIADQIERRTRYALTMLPGDQNPYLQYIATGNFTTALPRYLRAEHFDAVRAGLGRLTLCQGPIERAASVHGDHGFDGFNLSDIFEYVSDDTASQLYGELLKHANRGARLVYWNAFVPRSCPREYSAHVRSRMDESAELFARDKAFFYGHFQVDEVVSPLHSERT